MKYNYYYAPIFGKISYKPVCYFYITKWVNKNIQKPNEEFFGIVDIPKPCDRNVYGTDFSIPKSIFATMLLYQYLSKYEFVSDRVLGRVHDVTLGGKLELGMNFLKNFREYESGNMNPKAIQSNPKRLPMIKKLEKTPEYDLICEMSQNEFYFLTNLIYDTGLVKKIFDLTNRNANLLVKHDDIVSAEENALAEFTRNSAYAKIEELRLNGYSSIEVEPFSEFMKP